MQSTSYGVVVGCTLMSANSLGGKSDVLLQTDATVQLSGHLLRGFLMALQKWQLQHRCYSRWPTYRPSATRYGCPFLPVSAVFAEHPIPGSCCLTFLHLHVSFVLLAKAVASCDVLCYCKVLQAHLYCW
jgi:hypothetical protein